MEGSSESSPKATPNGESKHKYASVSWCVDDVLDHAGCLGIELTEEQAAEFLARNQNNIQDRMVERGWEAIETLLHLDRGRFHGQEKEKGPEKEEGEEAPQG